MRRPVWVTGIFAAAVVFGAIQFIRPAIPESAATADLTAPPPVKQILENSCYDCHSNQTRLAWFDQIVPAYWLVAQDVKDARHHLNFSEIGKLPAAQQRGFLYEAVSQIQVGAMPLPAYARLHPNAVVTPGQLSILKDYLAPAAETPPALASDLAADNAQYENWVQQNNSTRVVRPAPNGIEFLPDYKNWKAISTTDRFDNQTLRVILGNDTAVKAIAENHMNPWPDGTAFAKVAWLLRDDGQGHARSGAFFQVEFMIRDSAKYSSTKGWGWARWRGADLAPYGKDAAFPEECIGCHTPLRNHDYVFTTPLRGQLTGNLPANPLQWKVITSSADHQSSTMATLYGNDIATRYARTNLQQGYPGGSVLSLVTWTQKAEADWFGARVPAQVKSVEFVSVAADPDNQLSYSYENYQGSPPQKADSSVDHSPAGRTAYLLTQRAAVMP